MVVLSLYPYPLERSPCASTPNYTLREMPIHFNRPHMPIHFKRPQMPIHFKRPHMPTNRNHKALNRGPLAGAADGASVQPPGTRLPKHWDFLRKS